MTKRRQREKRQIEIEEKVKEVKRERVIRIFILIKSEGQREGNILRERETERKRYIERDIDREMKRVRDRKIERQIDREKKKKKKDRETERERESKLK